MKKIFKYIKLPLRFDARAMLQEVYRLADVWLPHYNSRDYSGEWKAIPLRSINGSLTNVSVQPTVNGKFMDTTLMEQCPAIQAAVSSLLCEKNAIRILNLRPGATINEHSDPGLCYEEGEIRLHIPLITNDDVAFVIDGERVALSPGECWYMNFNLKHKLSNRGATDRIHLVIDCLVNDWIHGLFASADDANVRKIQPAEKFSDDDRRLMIEQLRSIGTETALAMAEEMEIQITKQ